MTRRKYPSEVLPTGQYRPYHHGLPGRPSFQTLRQGLQALDAQLSRALAAAEQVYGVQAASDPFRGLYLSQEDVNRLMEREPGEPLFAPTGGGSYLHSPSDGLDPGENRFGWLRQRFSLDDFDLQALWIALAPEIDLRYERIYAYLQDDVTRRRPSVGLILDLLGATAGQRLELRERFSPAAPLLYSGLARLEAFQAGSTPGAGLLASALVLDEAVVRFLLGPSGPDPRLSEMCDWLPAPPAGQFIELIQEDGFIQDLLVLGQAQRVCAYFQGAPGSDHLQAAQLLASWRGQAVCHAPAQALLDSSLGGEPALELLLRNAEFNQALLLISGAQAVQDKRWLHARLQASQADVILAGDTAWWPHPEHPLGVVQLVFETPGVAVRSELWQAAAAEHGVPVSEALLDDLALRFRLRPGQVRAATAMLAANMLAANMLAANMRAANMRVANMRVANMRAAGLRVADQQVANRQVASSAAPDREAWFAVARAQSGQALQAVAQKITPRQRFDDLVLPQDSLAQLYEIAARVTSGELVLERWGFGKRMSLGRGVTALFSGPPGTGKTMAAEVVAGALGLDLYRIDLAQVVSKYIGETEKNLNAVFSAAEDSNAILFFDEADALFGRRSEVQDAHDRYANIEVAYLLQKMEQYEGAAILATNLRQNLDEAFMRRLSFVINFPFPDESSRQRIWQGIWPEETPVDSQLDFARLARRFRLSGGNIRNIALAAAYLAAQDGGLVTNQHLLLAVRREYQKMGKIYPEAEQVETV